MGQTLSEPIVEKTSHEGKNKHVLYGLSCMQGWRLTMEDAHCAELDLNGTEACFFGVYDGHGGSTVAQYTGQTLHHRVLESSHFEKKSYAQAMTEAYLQLDKELLEDQNFSYDPSGCTAVSALLMPSQKSIFVASDSRCIVSTAGQSKPLSFDHKPGDSKENQRIVKAGGFVEFGRVNGNLALSRAIGDFEFKQAANLPPEEQAVTCYPDVVEHTITDQDEFLVLACDGIWDCMSNREVVDFVRHHLANKMKLDEICEQMMDHCLAPESDGGGLGCDNMSVIIVALLHGRTEEEWYEWMANRAIPKKDALGNDIQPAPANAPSEKTA
ncbi:Protein phosphatase 2C 2 [Choanephora cucurbitarum]|uniref:protein-serine/threonine phosphatase n=1 Tax=Choanephora cucurbitarum TaxID=101091 RepID=A0A1C7MXI9_9FUNG|nr:Protein phosphatase 2C 2 [Choanephora cucurbitarum]OBZ86337.1 Protein phosphatase 2C 2 [Choanephora cucurbitarum]